MHKSSSLVRNRPPPPRPRQEPRHGPTLGFYGVAVSYERRTPVAHFTVTDAHLARISGREWSRYWRKHPLFVREPFHTDPFLKASVALKWPGSFGKKVVSTVVA